MIPDAQCQVSSQGILVKPASTQSTGLRKKQADVECCRLRKNETRGTVTRATVRSSLRPALVSHAQRTKIRIELHLRHKKFNPFGIESMMIHAIHSDWPYALFIIHSDCAIFTPFRSVLEDSVRSVLNLMGRPSVRCWSRALFGSNSDCAISCGKTSVHSVLRVCNTIHSDWPYALFLIHSDCAIFTPVRSVNRACMRDVCWIIIKLDHTIRRKIGNSGICA